MDGSTNQWRFCQQNRLFFFKQVKTQKMSITSLTHQSFFNQKCICRIQVHKTEKTNVVLQGCCKANQQELRHRQLSDATLFFFFWSNMQTLGNSECPVRRPNARVAQQADGGTKYFLSDMYYIIHYTDTQNPPGIV